MDKVAHTFEPIYDENSRILIVGTMPSVLSRRQNFYYGNPRNRFYGVLSALIGCEKPETTEQKIRLFRDNGIAVFDVIAECEIKGSSDLSIKNAKPNDFSALFGTTDIGRVFANGKAAHRYYQKFIDGDVDCLPSTSPANAAWSMERLVEAWSAILPYLKGK